MSWLSDHDLEQLASAQSLLALPIPTRPVSSDEFMPGPQSPRQRAFEARVLQLGTQLAKKQGLSRRRFFQTPAGMAAAFLAMNDTFGPLFGVSRAEAATPEHANERSAKLSGQFIMDMHTHFLRPGTRIMGFVAQRNAVGKAGWNKSLGEKEQTIDDLMFQNYIKEIYLDSDTKIACISGAPSEVPEDWFLTNQMKANARAQVNELTGTLRDNLEKVVHHGRRADGIVKNMLLHSREASSEHRRVDINAIVEESLKLAWHGARAEKQGFEIAIERSLDPTAGEVDIFPQDVTRALLNMIANGFYATTKRKTEAGSGGYEPVLSASTKSLGDRVEIRIRDNGTGMSPDVKEKMFDPFFTTKPAGEGTGLGLSISHDIIVKQHAGFIEVETRPGEFTEIRVILPRSAVFV